MNFVTSLALLITLVGIIPVIAHLLQRGRAPTIDFPATRWLFAEEHTAAKRSNLFDRALLFVRASIIVALAVLGAIPMVRCDRKTLERVAAASLARVVVLDDSGSMHAQLSQAQSKFDVAKMTTLALIDDLREGDSMAVVLASKPAKVLLAPSLSPKTLRRTLATLSCSDKATDIGAAVQLARSLLERLPHSDKRVLLLSDLAESNLTPVPDVTLVLPELTKVVPDCGLVSARHYRDRIEANVVCNVTTSTEERSLELLDDNTAARALGRVAVFPSAQTVVTFTQASIGGPLERARWVRFATADRNPANDRTPVIPMHYGRSLGYYADPVTSRPTTGGPPMVEQALRALDPNANVVAFSTVPDDARSLAALSVLVLDDPPNLSAEARSAITEFVRRGNTAIALFGPSASAAQLASLHLPFLEQQAKWQSGLAEGLEPKSLEPRLPPSSGLERLSAKGRFVFDESQDPNVIVRARWTDQLPFWIERPEGQGTLFVLGLPTQVTWSDWALRPGFLSILEQVTSDGERRGRARVITVGQSWQFDRSTEVTVTGPSGPLEAATHTDEAHTARLRYIPERVGRYEVRRGSDVQERIALWPPEETLTPSQSWPVTAGNKPNQVSGQLDVSRHVVLGLLALLVFELLLRLPIVALKIRKFATKVRTLGRASPNP